MKTNYKPILFSTEMVHAILAGRKTQTRRIVKPNIPAGNWEETLKHSRIQSGDILWVRETFTDWGKAPFIYKAYSNNTYSKAAGVKWKPSIHMPKEAARIFIKVKKVRCERLQDISEEDAIAEGAKDSLNHDDMKLLSNLDWIIKRPFGNHQFGFLALWQSINAKKYPWESNPWVWVYDFEKTEKPAVWPQ